MSRHAQKGYCKCKCLILPMAFVLALFFSGCAGTESSVTAKEDSPPASTLDETSYPTGSSPADSNAAPSASTDSEKEDAIVLTIGNKSFVVTLYDNESVTAFKKLLPLSIFMSELHGNEKYCYLPHTLPTDTENVGTIKAGELMLYGSDCLVLFYESFPTSYSYTRLGYVEDIVGLIAAVSSGSVDVTFALGEY